MNLLLDTHAFIWLTQGDNRLSRLARQHIGNSKNHSYLNVASLWEIAIKVSLSKLQLPSGFSGLVPRIEQEGITLLDVDPDSLSIVSSLPFRHKDPFDRLLAATALNSNYTLISADSTFDLYGVNRIW